MNYEPEMVQFIQQVPMADADGVPIREGSVLREIEKETRGVVTWIGRKDSAYFMPLARVGDIGIGLESGITRVTNRYSAWRHIPHNEQTYEERLLAWNQSKRESHHESISRDESIAIQGIMNLLPDDAVDWDNGPWPDTLDDALAFLSAHLTELATAKARG